MTADIGPVLDACRAVVKAAASCENIGGEGETPETAIDATRELQACLEQLFAEVELARRVFAAQGIHFQVVEIPKPGDAH